MEMRFLDPELESKFEGDFNNIVIKKLAILWKFWGHNLSLKV